MGHDSIIDDERAEAREWFDIEPEEPPTPAELVGPEHEPEYPTGQPRGRYADPDRRCSIDGCDKRQGTRGLCGMHYARLLRTGSTGTAAAVYMRGETPEVRFWAKVDRRGPDECWPWQARIDPKGYGRFNAGSESSQLAHVFAYELLIGPVPPGLELDHGCHTSSSCNLRDECPHRRCVNPAHLEPVTHRENLRRRAS